MTSEDVNKTAAGYRQLVAGDLAPWFVAPSLRNPRFTMDTTAGRWILLVFFGTTQMPSDAKALDELLADKPVSTSRTKPYGCSVKYAN